MMTALTALLKSQEGGVACAKGVSDIGAFSCLQLLLWWGHSCKETGPALHEKQVQLWQTGGLVRQRSVWDAHMLTAKLLLAGLKAFIWNW